ncbi:tripeptidyl peptidase A [Lactarius hatsudake]|nr:tripeptidyl peptidase A [Lactarius hatsudake]
MRVSALFGSLVVIAFANVAYGAPRRLKLRETIEPPRNWVDLGPAPPAHVIPLRIALPQARFPELEQHLAEISDPFHSRYGKYLSKEEVEALVAPHASSVDAVHEWLESYGIQKEACHRSPAGDLVTVRLPVAQAEEMLGTEFRVWKHTQDDDILVRTTGYSLPAHLDKHIELIQPTTAFNRAKGQRTTFRFSPALNVAPLSSNNKISVAESGLTVDASCNTTVTVSCLKQLYNAVGYVPRATNSIAITAYSEQYANIADLQAFYAEQVPQAVNSLINFASVQGGLNSQDPSQAGAEANLDVQFGFGISYPIPRTFYSTGGTTPSVPDANTPTKTNEPYGEWLDYVLAQEEGTLPLVISTSYGDDEQTVPRLLALRLCEEFVQLGARGVSLLFSSGDGGVGDGNPDPATQTCFTNDGKKQTKFIPVFPASCPFVTAVGGTVHIPEVAAGFSGGGFSNYFERPSWQNRAVQSFLKSLPKGAYAGLFNPAGRAIPDVSAQADFFRIFLKGSPVLIGGTSAAAPSFAAFVALLNDVRVTHGLSPLGFLNPLLYSLNGAGFNDITSGNAPGCGTPGFNATAGWDPVTGFGTPDFGKLRQLILE